MRQWYSFYSQQVANWQQLAANLGETKRQQPAAKFSHQLSDELEMPEAFALIPWFHHIQIASKSKTVKFIPEFVGKLNFYVSAADELLKADDDKPTIGLLICREADKTIVEWAFRGLDRPLGVATYQIEQIVQRTILEDKLKKQNYRNNYRTN